MNTRGFAPSTPGWTTLGAGAGLPLLLAATLITFAAEEHEKLKAGVVRVTATSREGGQKAGTGFVVRREGDAVHVVTASHVIEGAGKVEVEFFTRRSRPMPARVVGMEGGDPRGTALLVVEGQIPPGMVALKLAPSSVPVAGGDSALTIGFPRVANVPWAVIQSNVIGRTGRTITFSGAVDEGSSGAPLIKDGQVVGLVTEVANQVGYAVPAPILQYTLESWGVETREARQGGGAGPTEPPKVVPQVPKVPRAAVKAALDRTRIAFISFHDGKSEIYVMDPQGRIVQRLTSHRALREGDSPAWSPDGSKIAFVGHPMREVKGRSGQVYVMNVDGSGVRRLTDATTPEYHPAWSPDGTRVAYVADDPEGSPQIAVATVEGGRVTRLTRLGGVRGHPSWSPDGSKIVFMATPQGATELYVMNADGTNLRRLVGFNEIDFYLGLTWSPDGSKIAFAGTPSAKKDPDIYVMKVDGTGLRRLTFMYAAQPSWSPDGSRLAFASANSGSWLIYSMDADGSDLTRLTSGPRDMSPAWSPFLR